MTLRLFKLNKINSSFIFQIYLSIIENSFTIMIQQKQQKQKKTRNGL